MARAMAGYIGGLLEEVYGVAQSAEAIQVEPWLIAVGDRDGHGHQPDRRGDSGARRGGRRSGEGAAKGPLSSVERRRKPDAPALGDRVRGDVGRRAGCSIGTRWFFTAGYLLAVLAAVLLAPALALWLARALRPVLAWMRPVEGTLAADSLIQGPRRTSGTVAALMLSLALVISLGGLARSSYDSIADWMRIALNPDLFVYHGGEHHGAQLRLSGVAGRWTARDRRSWRSAAGAQRARDGEGYAGHAGRGGYRGSLARRAKLPAVEGDSEEMYREAAAGKRRDGVGEFRAAARRASWARCWKFPRRAERCGSRSSESCAIFRISRAAC